MYGNVISLNVQGSRDLDPRMTDLVSSRHWPVSRWSKITSHVDLDLIVARNVDLQKINYSEYIIQIFFIWKKFWIIYSLAIWTCFFLRLSSTVLKVSSEKIKIWCDQRICTCIIKADNASNSTSFHRVNNQEAVRYKMYISALVLRLRCCPLINITGNPLIAIYIAIVCINTGKSALHWSREFGWCHVFFYIVI